MAYNQHVAEGDWENGLCDKVCGGDCNTCLGAWCCSCFLFGRTTQRMKQYPRADKASLELFDSNCFVFCLAGYCGLQWIPMMMKRMDFRDQHNIAGNGCTDCLISACCTPCGLAQMETEIKDRAEKASLLNGDAQYENKQPGMHYQAPPAQVMQPPARFHQDAPKQGAYQHV